MRPPDHWLHWHRHYQHREFTDTVGVILHWIYISVFTASLTCTDMPTLSKHWPNWYRCAVEHWGTDSIKLKSFCSFIHIPQRILVRWTHRDPLKSPKQGRRPKFSYLESRNERAMCSFTLVQWLNLLWKIFLFLLFQKKNSKKRDAQLPTTNRPVSPYERISSCEK